MCSRRSIRIMLTFIMIVLFLFLDSVSASATTVAYDALSFSSSGSIYIYSNNPEIIDSSCFGADNGKYTVSQKLKANQQYCAEYSHMNNLTKGDINVAILICNTGSTNTTVNVQESSSVSFKPSSSYTNAAAQFERDFANKALNKDTRTNSITVKANNIVIINSQTMARNYEALGKAYFSTSSSNLYCKIVFYKSTYSGNEMHIVNKATSKESQTTGVVPSTVKTASYDVKSAVNKCFYLSSFQWEGKKIIQTNSNEYDTASNWYGCDVLYGNYGIYYVINIKNASGKYLNITPDWKHVHSGAPDKNEQDYAICISGINGDNWFVVTPSYTVKNGKVSDSYSIQLPTGVSQIGFVLSANNNGNVKFTIN